MTKDKKLAFTGERFTPECVREIWYEHYHRYAFAKRLIAGKTILDAACGEGYGSQILAENAKQVTGLDIDSETVNHARSRYKKNNLKFVQGSCAELPFEDASFDVIISFETLEHLEQQQEMLAEFSRVLNKDGILIISTPDKKHYSDATGFENEFHVKELYREEFRQLLNSHWQHQLWYSQAMAFSSIMEKIGGKKSIFATDILDKGKLETDKKMLTSMYYIVIATKQQITLPQLPDLHLFADKQQSVYKHYNETIRDYISVAEKYVALNDKHQKWLSTPILGKIIKFLERGK
ncbi:MAG: class I SAM-dependent methyltransferase [Alcanivoracaceae bacterium]|nr:class I SAM-dependent methyltransferase [Alcanivoracaceae bacterium]